jgi:AcrR family transcriptional regulator
MGRPPVLSDAEILRRAREVFLERGISARTRQLASAVGLTWGAIVWRFTDKHELFRRAMAAPAPPALEVFGDEQADDADLTGLLQRVRLQLWHEWPQHLQLRLASTTERVPGEPQGLREGLCAALQAHAGRGTVRRDLGAGALARMVMALLVGDVAQRYLLRDKELPEDPVLVDGVVALLKGC